MTEERILILDLGSQYTQLIARRTREVGIYSEVVRFDIPLEDIIAFKPKGIVLSGGPSSVYEKFSPSVNPQIFELGIPILGVCYGMQLMVKHFGGKVEPSDAKEFGRAILEMDQENPAWLFEGIQEKEMPVWMSHGDKVVKIPEKFQQIAKTSNTEFAAIESWDGQFLGIQFHPEVHHTVHGKLMIENWVRKVCGCRGQYKLSSFIDRQVAEIQARVGPDDVVICGLSGGVDSSVAAAIVRKALGTIECVLVDHGLLREGERQEVIDAFGGELLVVDREKEFLKALKGVTDPETKRKIIGKEFIDTFKDVANNLVHGHPKAFLVQGTLYPDVIESESVFSQLTDVIKSHHNVGGLPEELGFELIEPLRMMFKDEVREVGRELGLPDALVMRQPFPGPGLAIRCLGEVTKERLRTVRQADAIVRFEIEMLYDDRENAPWQYYAALLPVKSVGVMGDKRTYEETIVVRAVSSVDGMTADWSHLSYDLLSTISNRIVNEVTGVNRVVYDITSKPPGTIEWE